MLVSRCPPSGGQVHIRSGGWGRDHRTDHRRPSPTQAGKRHATHPGRYRSLPYALRGQPLPHLERRFGHGHGCGHNLLGSSALLAATALTSVSAEESQPQTLLEITFQDAGLLIALADPRLPALISNDREVLRRGFARASQRMTQTVDGPGHADSSLATTASEAAQAAVGAVQAVTGAAQDAKN